MTIPAGATVELEPGVDVRVRRDFTLTVAGTLHGVGTLAEPITLSSVTNFPPSIEVTGTMDLQHASLSGQVRVQRGADVFLWDSTFRAPGGLFNFSGSGSGGFSFIDLRRCTFTGATLDMAAATIRLEDVSFDRVAVRTSAMLWMDNVSVSNSPQQGYLLSHGLQPLYLNNVHARNNTGAGFDVNGGDFFFGPNNVIQGNEYPVAIPFGAGFAPGSVLPLNGNRNNYILGPDDGDVRFAEATWPDVGIPYVFTGNSTWFGRLDILPGTHVKFMPNSGLGVRQSKMFRGLPDKPIYFEPFTPGDQWFAVGFTSAGGGMEYCEVDGGGVTVAVTPAAHMENSKLTNSSNGLSPGHMSHWFVGGSEFINNPVAAQTQTSPFGSGGLHLNSPTNPNSFVGNGSAIHDITPGGSGLNDATNTWWGDPTGPQHPLNPGGLGEPMTAAVGTPKVAFTPWLTSPPDFTNHPPVVRMVQPPAVLDAGTKVILQWEASDDDQIVAQRIMFNEEGNFNVGRTIATLPASARSCEWTVPDVGFLFNAPSFLRIVAVDSTGQEGWDQAMVTIPSDEVDADITFTTMPTGVLRPGEDIDICWQISNPVGSFSMGKPFLAFEADEKFRSTSQFSNCTFLTRAPGISTDTARLIVPIQGNCCNRIKWFYSPYFEIRPDPRLGDAPPTITMISPSAGQSFAGGGTIPITWTASDDEALRSFKIQTSTDGGRTWQTIARDLDPAATSYNWSLPESAGIADARVRVVAIDLRFQNSSDGSDRPITILPGSGCYADCDASTGAGVLDIFDFLCFQNSFVAGEPYACDCDTSTGSGVCDIFDFLCFQDAFVSGCP
jgi:Bacterial Ig domain